MARLAERTSGADDAAARGPVHLGVVVVATIQNVYNQFDPMEALDADDPRYADCFGVRGVDTLHVQMSLPLGTGKPTSQLLSGHLGDGKTTILRQLRRRFEAAGHFVAYGETDRWLDLADIDHQDVLLGILVSVDAALRECYEEDVEAGLFQRFWERLDSVLHSAVDVKGSLPGLTAALRDVPSLRLQVRAELREARGPTFIEVVNEYLDRARELVLDRGHTSLVVILDNLDRLPELVGRTHVYPDEELFLGHANQLTRLHCHVIYVVRLALAHAHESSLRERYGRKPQIVPMVPVRRRDGTDHTAGLDKLREVLARRSPLGLEEAFEQQAVDLLCRKSGGHLRELMSLVQRACAEALGTHGELPIRLADAQAAVGDHGALRQQAAREYREALDKVSAAHDLSGLEADERNALLNRRLVYEYRDEKGYWYDVASLCEDRDA